MIHVTVCRLVQSVAHITDTSEKRSYNKSPSCKIALQVIGYYKTNFIQQLQHAYTPVCCYNISLHDTVTS